MVDWGRDSLMVHLLNKENWGLVIPRQAATDNWSHVQITRYMADNRIHYSNKGIPIECPLFLYSEGFMQETRIANYNTKIVKKIEETLGATYVQEVSDREGQVFSALDLLDYIYAVLHSNKYRKAYLEFLKFDFPRIPYPKAWAYFAEMVNQGAKLRMLHVNESDDYDEQYTYIGTQEVFVEKPYWEEETIVLSKSGDCIENVPVEIWNMYFGGYQPLQKWLKDRKNSTIGMQEVHHLQHIVTVLAETRQIMQDIDEIIML